MMFLDVGLKQQITRLNAGRGGRRSRLPYGKRYPEFNRPLYRLELARTAAP